MDADWEPFLEPYSLNLDDLATDAIVLTLESGGVEQISMSAVARYHSVTPSALHHRHGGRGAFLEAVVGRFSGRWIRWVKGAGRGSCADIVGEARLEERDHLRRCLQARRGGDRPTDRQLEVVMMLADGVRESVAHPDGRLDLTQGRAVLAETIGQLLGVEFEELSLEPWLDD